MVENKLGILFVDDVPDAAQNLLGASVRLALLFVVHDAPPIVLFRIPSLWWDNLDMTQKRRNLPLKGKQIDARAKYDKQIIVLPTIRFCLPSARRGIIKQTESHAARIAILPTRTMDADRIRALIPTFSWGIPTMAAFRPHDPPTSAVLRFPADHFGSCSSLRLRASSRAHSQCAQPSSFITSSVQSWPRPVITHPQQTKTNDMNL